MADPVMIEKDKLDQMLVEVSNELAEMLKAEQSALAKSSEDDAPSESSEGSQPPTEADGSAEGSPSAEGSAPPPAAEGSAPPAEASSPAPEMSGATPPDQPGEIEPAPTVEGLQAEYSQLDPESLKMHYLACKAALMAVMGADQGAGAPPPEASSPAAPPAPAAAPPAPPMMGKTELGKKVSSAEANGGQMTKSEKDPEVEALRRELEETKKLVKSYDEELSKFTKVMETAMTPVRKSVKNASDMRFIGRTGDESGSVEEAPRLTKKEVQAKLSEKISEGKLSKSDRELIYSYNIGKVSVEKIAHLLKDAQ